MSAIIRHRALIAGLGSVAGLLAALAGWAFRGDPAAAAAVDPGAIDLTALERVPAEVWTSLAGRRILFGHQSVGDNIIAGLEDIMRQFPQIRLRVVESRDPTAFDAPGLVHFKVGANESWDSKIADFVAVVEGPLGQRADFSMMKFCYVDLFAGGNPRQMFEAYRGAITRLDAARVLHVTIPLTTVQAGPKARVKRLLGAGSLWGYSDNAARNSFNNDLRGAFGASVFDLATSGATLPSGRRAGFSVDNVRYDCLSTGYSDDGGHLNEAGRRAAARDLLLFLAEKCK